MFTFEVVSTVERRYSVIAPDMREALILVSDQNVDWYEENVLNTEIESCEPSEVL